MRIVFVAALLSLAGCAASARAPRAPEVPPRAEEHEAALLQDPRSVEILSPRDALGQSEQAVAPR